jgi:RNA polymerase sigma-70 factor (ECF subfamily)
MQDRDGTVRSAGSDWRPDPDEAECRAIQQMRNGNIDGLEYLVEKYQLKAVRVAVLITCDRGLAEDVVQEAFLRSYHPIHQFDPGRPLQPWFLRSVTNAALRAIQLRDRSLGLDVLGPNGSGRSTIGQSPHDRPPEERITQAETSEVVWNALQSLPPEQRYALVMRHYFDLSEKQMSQLFDSPLGTIKWRLSAARQKLKRLLILNTDLPHPTNGAHNGE